MLRTRLVAILAFCLLGITALCAQTATVYIFRPHNKFFGTLGRPFVFCDGTPVRRIENGAYFSVDLPAGKHQLTAGDYQIGRSIELAPGATYYFVATFHKSVMVKDRPMWSLDPVPADEARQELARLKRMAANIVLNP